MPNRLIREGFLDSEAINSLSDSAECLYHRLLLTADDAGRMDGRAEILRARLYPLDSSRRTQDVVRLLRENEKQGLVMRYEWERKPFLQLARWQRPGSAQYSKFPWVDGSHKIEWVSRETRDGAKEFCKTSLFDPLPTPSAPPTQGVLPTFEKSPYTETETETETVLPQAAPQASPLEEEFDQFWKAYPRKKEKLAAFKAWKKLKPSLEHCLQAIETLRKSHDWQKESGQFIPYPASWLNAGGWDDVPKIELGRLPGGKAPQSAADPEGWKEWRDAAYPDADKAVPFSQVSRIIQKEFEASQKTTP